MLHITFAVGFPLSVLVSRVGPGQFRRGGSTSLHGEPEYPEGQLYENGIKIEKRKKYATNS